MDPREFSEIKIQKFRALRTQFSQTADFSRAKRNTLPIGITAVDKNVGGLFYGAINEFSGSIASASLLFGKLLDCIQARDAYLALVDASNSFAPREWTESLLGNMLWVRCHSTNEALRATDFLLKDGNFLIVVLDLQMSRTLKGIYSNNIWNRFAKILERSKVIFLVLSLSPIAQAVQLRIIDESNWDFEALQMPRKDLYANLKISVDYLKGALQKRVG